jgi:hypothetical protein
VEVSPPVRARAARFLIGAGCLLALAGCGRDGGDGADRDGGPPEGSDEVVLTPEAAAKAREAQGDEDLSAPRSKARVVELEGAGAEPDLSGVDPKDDAPSPGAPTDAEVRAELREARAALSRFKRFLNTTAYLPTGPRARVLPDGTAGLLDRPLTSGLLAGYGAPGPGRWITIYANSGHVFMVVAGLRFDTSGQGRAGTRWQEEAVTTSGYAVRHIPGL